MSEPTMKTMVRIACGLLLAVTASSAFANDRRSTAADLWPIDGIDGFLLGLLLDDDTVYAAGYSAHGFRRVDVGMTQAQVHRLLGSPQKSWPLTSRDAGPDFGERWSYSRGDTHYRIRVVLYRSGRVVEKHADFYVD